MDKKDSIAIFAGGCFWCTEAIFGQLRGVASAVPGYVGGSVQNPSYEQVCSGNTGHAEAVRIAFNEEQISFQDLLEVFFATHDPTQLNRQGNDVGTQYRSAVFYTDEEQKQIAEKFIKDAEDQKLYSQKIVTTLEPFAEFYEAEQYHKDYYLKNSSQPYCQFVINPKITKFKQKFASLLKPE